MKWVSGFLLSLLLLSLVLIVSLPLSEPGSRILVALATRFLPVSIEFESGRLFGQFALERLVVTTDRVQVELGSVRAELDPSCLWESRFCLSSLDVQELHIIVLEGNEVVDTPAPAPGFYRLPVLVWAPQVRVGETRIEWEGGRWTHGEARLSVAVEERGIRVESAEVADPRLEVFPKDSPREGRLEMPELWLPFTLSVAELQLQRPGWNLLGRSGGVDRLSLDGRWRGSQLTLSRASADRETWGEAALVGELEFRAQWPLVAQLSLVPSAEVPLLPLQTGKIQMSAAGDLARLEFSFESEGPHRISGDGWVDTLDPDVQFALEGSLDWDDSLALGDLMTVPEGLPEVRLLAPLELRSRGSLLTQSLVANLHASGAGYESAAIDLDAGHDAGSLYLNRLTITDPGTRSAIAAEGVLTVGEGITASLRLTSEGIRLPQMSDHLSGRVRGALQLGVQSSAERWQVDIDDLSLDGEINGLPASASGVLALDSERIIAGGDLAFDINGAGGRLTDSASGSGARMVLAVADLGRWRHGSTGALTVDATLSGRGRHLRMEAAVERASWGEWQFAAARAEGALNLADPEQFDATIKVSGLRGGELSWEEMKLAVESGSGEGHARLHARGDIEGELQLAAQRSEGRWEGQLAATELVTPVGVWTLPSAVAGGWRDDSLFLADHCWQADQGSLCASAIELGRAGGTTVSLDGAMALLAPLVAWDGELTGSLSGELVLHWDAAKGLAANAELAAENGSISQRRADGAPAIWYWDTLEAGAHYAGGGLSLDARLQRQGRKIATFDIALPPAREQALAGKLTIAGLDLAALQAFVPGLSRLEGTLSGDWELAGTAEQPVTGGRLQWRQGALALHTSPTVLSALEMDMALRGDNLALEGSGMLGGGPVDMEGTLQLRHDWGLDLFVRGQNNHLVWPPSLAMTVSPDLEIRARAGLTELQGSIRVEDGVVEQDQLPQGSVDLSPDVVEVDYKGNAVAGTRPFDTSMDIGVFIADSFLVRGNGLEARVGGDLQLQQQAGRPLQLYGNLNVVGGQLRAYGQRLDLRQGRISFAGVVENPELDLRAERDIPLERVTAGVRVTGTVEAPELQIYTDPSMPQNEALSYLVRGRGLDTGAGTGADGTALALSLGTGIVNRSAVVEGLNQLPGLSQIEFGATGSEQETAATVSGYIGERIYLSYGVGLYEPVNVLTARLYLQTRLWLEVVSRLESSVDLYYSFDID